MYAITRYYPFTHKTTVTYSVDCQVEMKVGNQNIHISHNNKTASYTNKYRSRITPELVPHHRPQTNKVCRWCLDHMLSMHGCIVTCRRCKAYELYLNICEFEPGEPRSHAWYMSCLDKFIICWCIFQPLCTCWVIVKDSVKANSCTKHCCYKYLHYWGLGNCHINFIILLSPKVKIGRR